MVKRMKLLDMKVVVMLKYLKYKVSHVIHSMTRKAFRNFRVVSCMSFDLSYLNSLLLLGILSIRIQIPFPDEIICFYVVF